MTFKKKKVFFITCGVPGITIFRRKKKAIQCGSTYIYNDYICVFNYLDSLFHKKKPPLCIFVLFRVRKKKKSDLLHLFHFNLLSLKASAKKERSG